MLDAQTRLDIRAAFLAGVLKVQAVDPTTGAVDLHQVTAVLRHAVPDRPLVAVTLIDRRRTTFTVDHSLFQRQGPGLRAVRAGDLRVGDLAAVVDNEHLGQAAIAAIESVPCQEYAYDLSVPGPQNFVLADGTLAHNSYSIGGVSLDLEKSGKYQTMMDAANQKVTESGEMKARTVQYIRGLQQSRYGYGLRSALGAYSGKGIQSPRNFMVWPFVLVLGEFIWHAIQHGYFLSALLA